MKKILFLLLTFTLLTLCADEELPPVTLATVKLPQIRLAEIPTVSAAAKLATATVNLPVIPSTAPQLNAAKARLLRSLTPQKHGCSLKTHFSGISVTLTTNLPQAKTLPHGSRYSKRTKNTPFPMSPCHKVCAWWRKFAGRSLRRCWHQI